MKKERGVGLMCEAYRLAVCVREREKERERQYRVSYNLVFTLDSYLNSRGSNPRLATSWKKGSLPINQSTEPSSQSTIDPLINPSPNPSILHLPINPPVHPLNPLTNPLLSPTPPISSHLISSHSLQTSTTLPTGQIPYPKTSTATSTPAETFLKLHSSVVYPR